MREALSYLKSDRVLKYAFLSSTILLLGQIFFLLVSYVNLPPLVPLYLQRPWGITQIAQKTQILLLPLITISLIFFNSLFAARFYKENPLASRILLWGESLFSLLILLAVVRIILLVT